MKVLNQVELENVAGGSGIYDVFYGLGRGFHQGVNFHAEHRRKYGYNPYGYI